MIHHSKNDVQMKQDITVLAALKGRGVLKSNGRDELNPRALLDTSAALKCFSWPETALWEFALATQSSSAVRKDDLPDCDFGGV